MSDGTRQRGFTLVELVIVVAIVGILAAAALPLARWSVKRSHEHELRESLRILRLAIDRYQDAARAGLIEVPEGGSGYPPSLEALVEGVPMIAPMPDPALAAVGAYAASGPGLDGGLAGLVEAQGQAAGGLGSPGLGGGAPAEGLAGVGPDAGGPMGRRPGGLAGMQGMLRGLRGVQSLGDVDDVEDDAGSSFGGSGFSSTFGSRGGFGAQGGFGSGGSSPFASFGDADGDGAGSGPLLGADGQPIKMQFLRRIPVDPMTGDADWGLRCYGEPPDDRLWCGTDVFDIYSKSLAKAIDGSDYRDW